MDLIESYLNSKDVLLENDSCDMKGNSYGKTIEEIAKKHGVEISNKEFRTKIATMISLDHLYEASNYYTLLEEMEKKFKKNNLTS